MPNRILCLLLFGALLAHSAEDWKSSIRRDHPRLFFNKDSWPAVRARVLNEESRLYAAMKARVDELAQ